MFPKEKNSDFAQSQIIIKVINPRSLFRGLLQYLHVVVQHILITFMSAFVSVKAAIIAATGSFSQGSWIDENI